MNSKHIGADMVFALPDAKVGMMDADVAAKIMYADDKDADVAQRQQSLRLSQVLRQQQQEDI